MDEKIVWNYCSICNNTTKHSMLYEKEYEGEYEEFKILKQTVECCGCENVSFRTEEHDYWDIYEDYEGQETHRVKVENYPSVLHGHNAINNLYLIPPSIRPVYDQTLLAFKGKSHLLAGVGFRAIIEALCIQEKIKGNNLEIKINNLAKNRLITEREANRLHTIRFLGNDSVHEMEIPTLGKLMLVLGIIENLLKNLYIIDREAKNVLDTIITDYNDFEELLWQCAEKHNKNEPKSLKEFLGKHVRRIKIDLEQIEVIIKTRIESKEIEFLELGVMRDKGDVSEQLYLYNGKEFDEIPF